MGYMRHHTIVVCSFDKKLITKVQKKAEKIFKKFFKNDYILNPIVSNIYYTIINRYYSFFIAPDGSKEGWEHSSLGDEARKEIIEYIKSLAYEDGSNAISYAELFFGDDEGEAKILNHN